MVFLWFTYDNPIFKVKQIVCRTHFRSKTKDFPYGFPFMDINGDRIVIWWYNIYIYILYIILYLHYIILHYIILYYNYIILHCVKSYLVGGAITILKNDGLRQWETSYPIYICIYITWKIKHLWNHQPVIYLMASELAKGLREALHLWAVYAVYPRLRQLDVVMMRRGH